MRQKAKEEWLTFGDRCSKHFHKFLKAKKNRSAISEITDKQGIVHRGQSDIAHCFSKKKFDLLGTDNTSSLTEEVLADLPFAHKLSSTQIADLMEVVTDSEIKNLFFDMDSNKSPGPDGLNGLFFKECWGIIGSEICNAMKNTFTKGKI